MLKSKSKFIFYSMLGVVLLFESLALCVYLINLGVFNKHPSPVFINDGKIHIVGKSDDGLYPIYDLTSSLGDVCYYSSKGGCWKFTELPDLMIFIAKEDAKSGTYLCEIICKDNHGRTVGLNPAFAKMFGRPVPHRKYVILKLEKKEKKS